jgi:voltage-gated potassium channel
MRKLCQAGADHTVAPFKSVALIAAEYIGQPVAFEAIYSILSVKEGIGLDTVTIHANASITGTCISEINFLAHKLILFGVICPKNTRNTKKMRTYELRDSALHFNPSPEFVLSAGDTLVLIGHEYSITHFKEQLELNKS